MDGWSLEKKYARNQAKDLEKKIKSRKNPINTAIDQERKQV